MAVLALGVALLLPSAWASRGLGGSVCGNHAVEAPEACDDGNTLAGDGCAPECTCEPEICGDGIKGCTEECDDGNTEPCDDCPPDCFLDSDLPLCVPQDRAQQACISSLNQSLARVIKAQNADNRTCIEDVASGRQPGPGACLGEDLTQKVAKAQARTTVAHDRKCKDPDETPGYSYTDPSTVNSVAAAQVLEAAATVLGAAPNVVLSATDAAGAACQAEVMKQLGAVSSRWADEANKAKRRTLKGGKESPASNAAQVAAGIDTGLAASAALERAEVRATAAIARRCDDTQANAAADCGGATTAAQVAACVVAAAEEGACNAFELADGLALDCPSLPAHP